MGEMAPEGPGLRNNSDPHHHPGWTQGQASRGEGGATVLWGGLRMWAQRGTFNMTLHKCAHRPLSAASFSQTH